MDHYRYLGRMFSPANVVGFVATAVPSTVFVGVNSTFSLLPATMAACMSAICIFAFRLARRQPSRPAIIGLAIALVCAAIASITGDARDFFIAPALIPATALVICTASLIVHSPLTGILLNRVAGGPVHWRQVPALQRIYSITTAVALLINLGNLGLQAIFYLADEPVVLAIIHVGTAPAFAALVAVTVVFARKEITRPTRDAGTINN